MSAELILPLAGYWLLLAAGLCWIALDAETAYIFDVFGKNFDYMWRHSGHRWKFTFMYGWRLIAVALIISACLYFAWLLVSSLAWSAASLALFTALAAVGLFLLPWIKIASRFRFKRTLRKTALALTPVARQLAETVDISSVLDDAHYKTASNWSAWHPKSKRDWPVVVPVAYVHAPPSVAVLFPVDWKCFLAWKLDNQLPPTGAMLPFNGPFESTFILRGAWPLRRVPDWSIVQADLHLDDAAPEDV